MIRKGQLTIPKDVRERLGLRTGDQVDIRIESDDTVRLLPAKLKVQDVFGMLSAYKKKRPVTVGQMKRTANDLFPILPQDPPRQREI